MNVMTLLDTNLFTSNQLYIDLRPGRAVKIENAPV